VNEKFDKKLVSLKYKPFMLFRYGTSPVCGDAVDATSTLGAVAFPVWQILCFVSELAHLHSRTFDADFLT
jgi:hypothetical protein